MSHREQVIATFSPLVVEPPDAPSGTPVVVSLSVRFPSSASLTIQGIEDALMERLERERIRAGLIYALDEPTWSEDGPSHGDVLVLHRTVRLQQTWVVA